jgi:hypothetical protein
MDCSIKCDNKILYRKRYPIPIIFIQYNSAHQHVMLLTTEKVRNNERKWRLQNQVDYSK